MPVAPLHQEPKWLNELPSVEREAALVVFHLGVAALHASPSGTMKGLADLLGCPESTLSRWKSRGSIPPMVCVAIESLLGREVMPRELLAPSIFLVGDRA